MHEIGFSEQNVLHTNFRFFQLLHANENTILCNHCRFSQMKVTSGNKLAQTWSKKNIAATFYAQIAHPHADFVHTL